MKDSQDWLDKILEDFAVWDTCGQEDCEHYREYKHAKSAIRKHILQEALEMINSTPKLILKGKFEDDMGLFGDYVEVAELRNKFNDKYKED